MGALEEKTGFGKKILAGGIVLGALTIGCMKTPSPGQFREKGLICIPSLPFATLFKGGKYDFEKINKNNKWIGVTVIKSPWLFGKKDSQRILFPEKSENHGFDITGPFDMLWISYDLPDGNRHLDMHTTKQAADNYELREHYILDKEKNKYIKQIY